MKCKNADEFNAKMMCANARRHSTSDAAIANGESEMIWDRMQKIKMRELWDNKEDEAWENA